MILYPATSTHNPSLSRVAMVCCPIKMFRKLFNKCYNGAGHVKVPVVLPALDNKYGVRSWILKWNTSHHDVSSTQFTIRFASMAMSNRKRVVSWCRVASSLWVVVRSLQSFYAVQHLFELLQPVKRKLVFDWHRLKHCNCYHHSTALRSR